MRRTLALSATIVTVIALGAACGSDATTSDAGTNGGTNSGTNSAAVKSIDITVADGTITPSGDEVDVALGQPIELVVTADAPGEIHVHSDPEQEFEYEGTGGPETFQLRIDRPGQVDVESHTLDELIVKLVVQ